MEDSIFKILADRVTTSVSEWTEYFAGGLARAGAEALAKVPLCAGISRLNARRRPARPPYKKAREWIPMIRPVLLAFSLFISILPIRAADPKLPDALGGRVGWGRLITESSSWSVHSQNDPLLTQFIRSQTSLNIDEICYPVDPQDLGKLCAYPFVFTNNLTNVRDPKRLANLREYLHRGGFIYIDRCVNLSFSLPQEPFYERHIALFTTFLPGCEIRELESDHDIYRCYFSLGEKARDARRSRTGHSWIYGVYDGGRMVALLSLANLQCGWPGASERRDTSMKMIANIYVYTMTR